jgi:hypothetical protein
MAVEKQTQWVFDHHFERHRARHVVNGATAVLHCHNYAILYCQIADDAEIVNGRELLARAAEYAFLSLLRDYFATHAVTAVDERVALAEEYWSVCGMGTLKFDCLGQMSATAVMAHSHVDEGWVAKWGRRDRPVNFIGQGYLAAALAAIYDRPAGSFAVRETESIVAGAPESRFAIVRA